MTIKKIKIHESAHNPVKKYHFKRLSKILKISFAGRGEEIPEKQRKPFLPGKNPAGERLNHIKSGILYIDIHELTVYYI